MAGKKTPRKRTELLLAAVALFGAAAALIALGAAPAPPAAGQSAVPQPAAPGRSAVPQPPVPAVRQSAVPQPAAPGRSAVPQPPQTSATILREPAQPVNLNTATQAQLETLPGIGAVKAQAILAWRAAHGGFANVNQLLEIKGIGEKTLQSLLPYIIV